MSYFKINNNDYSIYVNALNVNKVNVYNEQVNAAGDTVVDFINSKRVINVGIIPLTAEALKSLTQDLDNFNVSVTFLNPRTNELETASCIIPDDNIEYYTIQANNVLTKAFSLQFQEL
jgi:hypothetical protein